MTQEVINKLEQAFSVDATDIESCLFAGISHQTLYNYQEKHPQFLERKAALKHTPILKARGTVVKAVAVDPNVARWYLERRRPEEFMPRHATELTGAGGAPLTFQVVNFADPALSSDPNPEVKVLDTIDGLLP